MKKVQLSFNKEIDYQQFITALKDNFEVTDIDDTRTSLCFVTINGTDVFVECDEFGIIIRSTKNPHTMVVITNAYVWDVNIRL